ncbi:hypothetical protein P74p20 [Thermus phage P74-26]|uniref:Uncharacterized protein n=1 Tax=Thermus phage P74-26 TaxID=2914007 RepID=A7XXI4_BP742|nr:hypothetical protein P74p20 [Thermus phage P74-26]ABU96970.1 hypothetical protein P74p20 [Thermus phage P74-26]
MTSVQNVIEVYGLYGGLYQLIDEGSLERLKPLYIPGKDELHTLVSFILITPPYGLTLKVGKEILGDDEFFLVVLLNHRPQTFASALRDGNVFVSFPGN